MVNSRFPTNLLLKTICRDVAIGPSLLSILYLCEGHHRISDDIHWVHNIQNGSQRRPMSMVTSFDHLSIRPKLESLDIRESVQKTLAADHELVQPSVHVIV